jgi:hypothetical protein
MTSRNLIDFAQNDDAVSFRKELYADIHDRVMAHIDAKKQEVAQNMFKKESTIEDYSLEEIEQFMHSEEYEQLDELSKNTLGNYVKKASHDVATKSAAVGRFSQTSRDKSAAQDYTSAKKDSNVADKAFSSSWNRRKNIAKAVDRLAKESTGE